MTIESILGHYHNGTITAGSAAIYLLGLLTSDKLAEVMPLLPNEVCTQLLRQVSIDPSQPVIRVNAPLLPEAHHVAAIRRWFAQQQIVAK